MRVGVADRAGVADSALLALLAFDGFLTVVLAALFLPTYIGSVAFPISALVCGVVNVALVVAAALVTDRNTMTCLPLVGWGFGFFVCLFGGPGGDVILGQSWQTVLLLFLGVVPAGYALYRIELNRARAKQLSRQTSPAA